jgi:hypothetical protein
LPFHRNSQRRQCPLWSIIYSINTSDRLELKDVSIVITDKQSDLLEISMKNTARNTLLVTVAATALIAGAGFAWAQGTGETREAPGAATHEPKTPGGRMEQQPNGMPQKSPAPNAQAPIKPAPTAQTPARATPAPTAQAPGQRTGRCCANNSGGTELSHDSDHSKVRAGGRAVHRTTCEDTGDVAGRTV